MHHNVRMVCTSKNEFLSVEGAESFSHYELKFSTWPGGTKGELANMDMQLPPDMAALYTVGEAYYFFTKLPGE